MWKELELQIKICDKCNPHGLKTSPIIGEGNKNADIVVVFDSISKSMSDSKSIIFSEECKSLKPILKFVKIDFDNCYFTTLTKYYNKEIIGYEERYSCMKFLLEENLMVE